MFCKRIYDNERQQTLNNPQSTPPALQKNIPNNHWFNSFGDYLSGELRLKSYCKPKNLVMMNVFVILRFLNALTSTVFFNFILVINDPC
jgi:hypothetical protein